MIILTRDVCWRAEAAAHVEMVGSTADRECQSSTGSVWPAVRFRHAVADGTLMAPWADSRADADRPRVANPLI